jgi:hypothetical protein
MPIWAIRCFFAMPSISRPWNEAPADQTDQSEIIP